MFRRPGRLLVIAALLLPFAGIGPADTADAAVTTTATAASTSGTATTTATARPAAPVLAVAAGDGTSAATAGASCWSIKQDNPSAASGTFWLLTPQLVYPQRFYCDMETDGGGWVLIGRGREGWAWRDRGQGILSAVAGTPSGTGAFAVAYYPSATVDALLGGTRPDALADGVRVRRAANATGTAWQQLGYALASTPSWSWSFAAGLPATSFTVGDQSYPVTNTTDTYPVTPNDARRAWTWSWTRRAVFGPGFAYGPGVAGGGSAATDYLWQSVNAEGHPVPFAQVFIRPRLQSSAAAAGPIPDAGLPAVALRPLLRQTSEPLSGWGVTGYDTATATSSTWKANVVALAQVGQRIYVGGTFQAVRKGAAGYANPQRYLAAFDRATGAYDPTFKPVLNGGVWALTTTAAGKLIVGGRFTTVNGLARPGLVALNPVTGAIDTTWAAYPASSSTTKPVPTVRALASRGPWIYASGQMTSVTGGVGTDSGRITVSSMVRLKAGNGRPDPAFRPVLSSQAWDIWPAAAGDRVYAAGSFTTVNGAASNGTAVLSAVNGTTVPGLAPIAPSYDCRPNCGTAYHPYAQAIRETADGARVVAGPTEHNLQLLGRAAMNRTYSHITLSGGDYQNITETAGVVYASCHCFLWDYSGRTSYAVAGPTDRISSISGVGAYDAATLTKLDAFEPSWKGAYGDGFWASLVDSAGCVWFGGDATQGSSSRWAGGFLTYCPRDVTPPTAPAGLTATSGGTGTRLAWTASSDASGALTYQVLRDDRVIAVTSTTAWTDAQAPAGVRYAVRAADATGNLSASTPGLDH